MKALARLPVLTVLLMLTACATPTLQGRAALSRGSYDEAARHFEEALTAEPGRVGALVGLGVARYKLDALDDARRAFEEALAQQPDLAPGHLYLALIALRQAEDATAEAYLTRYLALAPPARLATLLDRTRRALAGPVTTEMRTYMAAALEDGYQWTGEVAGAVQAARDAELLRLSHERIYIVPSSCRCR
jgi:tetratricopeptide (TPR) repeat protein